MCVCMYVKWIFCLVTIFLFLIFLIELSNLYYIKWSFCPEGDR